MSCIREHGAEYIDLSADLPINYWICDYCDAIIKISRSQTTWNISRHLLNIHGIYLVATISGQEGDLPTRAGPLQRH